MIKINVLVGSTFRRRASYHAVFEVAGTKPRRVQQLRSGVRECRVEHLVCCRSRLNREVPVRNSQLGVDELKAVFEGVGDERVGHQEANSFVKLGTGGECSVDHGRVRAGGGGRGSGNFFKVRWFVNEPRCS